MPGNVPEFGRHRLPNEVFDQFCAGGIGATAIAMIRAGQYSRRRLLLCALMDVAGTMPRIAGPLDDPEAVWRILTVVDDERPDVVEDILTHPTVGVWIARTLRKAQDARYDPIPLWTDLGYLHCLAAAAAIRSGVACEIRVPVTYGAVTLPTVGQIRLMGTFPIGFAVLTVGGHQIQLTAGCTPSVTFVPSQESEGFVPVRRYRTTASGISLDVEIDDCDPYREFAGSMPPCRLDPTQARHWRKLITEAWQILTSWHPPHARELGSVLRTLVPISGAANVTGASSSAAFGSIALAAADSATSLAETLLHEVQHSKLNALLDLVRLHNDDDNQARWYAPWRDDPRPLTGLLHGIYAFITAAEYWLVQRDLVTETEVPAANLAFALRRYQIRQTVAGIRASGRLTTPGLALVDAVAARLKRCESAIVPSGLAELVTMMGAEHQMIWRLRHVRPSRADIRDLATAWRYGTTMPAVDRVSCEVAPDTRGSGTSAIGDLLRLRALDPAGSAVVPRGCGAADAAFVSRDYKGAKTAYQAQIRAVPNDIQAWAGLGLALRALGSHRAADALLEAPEIAYSLYQELLSLKPVPDPAELAEWLGSQPAD